MNYAIAVLLAFIAYKLYEHGKKCKPQKKTGTRRIIVYRDPFGINPPKYKTQQYTYTENHAPMYYIGAGFAALFAIGLCFVWVKCTKKNLSPIVFYDQSHGCMGDFFCFW